MDSQIRIRKLNHAFIKIESEMDIAMELGEAFKFMVDGAKYSPAFKMGQWDGFIRLFNIGSRTMTSGLFDKVVDFAVTRGYTYEVVDDSERTGFTPPGYKTPGITIEVVKAYMESLNLHARGEKLEIRDYQIQGVLTGIRDRQAILVSSVGSGKSMMLYCIIRYITEELGERALLIVPTIGLTTQMHSDFADYSSHNGYDVEENLHLITGGVEKNTSKPVVVSTFQSLKGIGAPWLNSFGAIITDEGHKIQAKSFQDIYGGATHVPFRLTCTGTMHDTKCNVLTMIGLTGPVVEIALTKDLIEAKQLVPLKIKCISLDYPKDVCTLAKKMDYDEELNWIITHPKRNNFIKNLAVSCKGTTLVFFRFIMQGQDLYDRIKEAVGDTRKVFLIDGDVDKDMREEIRLAAGVGDPILVVSYGTMSAGVNMPAVENMIIAHPIKSKITFLQSIGRGLRLKAGKLLCNLFDIGDNLSVKTKVNTTFRHFGERLKLLTAEGYTFTIVNVPF